MTYYELLGVTPKCPNTKIKERYKSLCLRAHPDKGGSKALMQLVLLAYNKIAKGKGEQRVHFSSLANEKTQAEKSGFENALKALKKERDEQIAQNTELKRQLNKQKSQGESRSNALLEGKMALLKEECNRLAQQQKINNTEKKKLACDLRKALSENEMLETTLNRKSKASYGRRFYLIKGYAYPLCVVFLMGILLFILVEKAMKSSFFKAEEQDVAQRKSRVIYDSGAKKKALEEQNTFEDQEKEEEENFNLPFLKLTDRSGIWSLSAYTGSQKPYIAIRSENGSYVVNDCSGHFMFYFNQALKPLRVAANLIYSHQNQYFHVYKIPYGQGSSSESWLQSRKLEINAEYFTSQEFDSSRDSLLKECLAITS